MVDRIIRLSLIVFTCCLWLPVVAHSAVCEVTIGFADPNQAPLSGVLVDIDYQRATARPVVELDRVACTALVPEAVAEFIDAPESNLLKVGVVRLAGFSGPSLFRCTFAGGILAADDLTIAAFDAASPDFEPVIPPPALTVSAIACDQLCSGSAALNCDDGNVCTSDGCDSTAGCMHTNNTAGCSDGDVCTTADVCSGGVCSGEMVPGCGQNPGCGNGTVEGDEQCDDGNRDDGDACRNDCREATCGDGVVRGGFEDCDAGDANSNVNPDACRSDCTAATCGDAVVDSGEQCDDGNDSDEDACVAGCADARCGDGHLNQGFEECDDGEQNSDSDPGACRSDCRLAEICGDADGNGVLAPTDAVVILYNAVKLFDNCPRSRCDVNGSATLTATDARTVLTAAVDLPVELDCTLPVEFRFDTDAVLGSLQFVVDYSQTASTFVGEAENVFCTTLDQAEAGVVASFDNDVDRRELHVALVASSGFQTAAAVAVCSFQQAGDLLPVDFAIEVLTALGPDSEPIQNPQMSAAF